MGVLRGQILAMASPWSQQAGLGDQMWGVREKEEWRMTPGLGAHARGKRELPFINIGETVAGAGYLFGD